MVLPVIRAAASRRGPRSPESAQRRARRVWSLLALPLTLCLLFTGPAHLALHGHGSTEACGHGHEGRRLSHEGRRLSDAGRRLSHEGGGLRHASGRVLAEGSADHAPLTVAEARLAPAPAEVPAETLQAAEAAAADECGLCLFAGAPVAHTAVASNGPTPPPLRIRPAPSARPSSPCTGLPAPRGPPTLG